MSNRITEIIKLSQQAFGKYKFQIIVLTILGFASGLLEAIGINALIPLFSFVVGDSQGGSDVISRLIEKIFLYFNINFSLEYLLIFISLLFVLKAVVLVFFSYIKVKITADYEAQTRNELFRRTLKADWPYLLKQKLGHLETILMIDVKRATTLLEKLSGTLMMATGLLMYILVAINISLYITLITLALGGILFLAFIPLLRKTRNAATRATKTNKEVAHYVNENILGMKAIKTMIAGDKVIEKGKDFFNQLKELHITVYLLFNISRSILQPISLIFICLVFAFSYKAPNFNFAALAAVIYLIQRIFQYIQQIQGSLHKVSESVPYLRSVLDYSDEISKNKEKSYGNSYFKFNDKLEFKNVSFAYNQEKEILTGVNFIIKKGEMVGLVGPSGAGKTTIVDLILRLFTPSNGQILLDDKDISKINLRQWRKNIGYVSQDIFLTNDSIADNIKFYDKAITDEEMERAVKMANIYEFIQSCPDKFSTKIGERGIQLSVGQRQRIIIARVLARKPKCLILDEATSALDNESEIKIQKVIENLRGRVTVLAIAHRLSTIINSDKLLILEQGKITEQGDAQELLKDKKSYFYKVYNIRE